MRALASGAADFNLFGPVSQVGSEPVEGLFSPSGSCLLIQGRPIDPVAGAASAAEQAAL